MYHVSLLIVSCLTPSIGRVEGVPKVLIKKYIRILDFEKILSEKQIVLHCI